MPLERSLRAQRHYRDVYHHGIEVLRQPAPPGGRKQREADYLCLTVTYAIMYHCDGSTVNATGVPAAPQPVRSGWRLYVFLTWWAALFLLATLLVLLVGGGTSPGFHRACAERPRGKHLEEGPKLDAFHAIVGVCMEWGQRGRLHTAGH